MVGSNMSGTEKLLVIRMLVIRKSNNPRCFKGTKSLPMWCKVNKKAWVTLQLFEDYIQRLYQKFQLQKQAVLLYVDNCISNISNAHIQSTVNQAGIPPSKLGRYPSTWVYPSLGDLSMDQGVIQNLKVNYRRQLPSHTHLCPGRGRTR